MTLPAKYVSRSSWGARIPTSVTILLPSAVTEIVYHYTASNADEQADHANCAARVRGIQRFHMTPTPQDKSKPWSDIAYSFVVCKHGYIFEGRGLERKTAATGEANNRSLAVVFLGDDTVGSDDVTYEGRQGLVNVTRYVQQARPFAQKLSGHRDHMSTSCPGNEIAAYIRSDVFKKQLLIRDDARMVALRKWILAQRAAGWSWERIKDSANWREFVLKGGR